MRLLLASVLLLAACKCPCPCGPDAGADMSAPRDLARPADLSVPTDLARPADLSAPPDLSRAPDLAVCIKCDAVLNTCPSRGLDCDPVAGCCVAKPADLAVPLR